MKSYGVCNKQMGVSQLLLVLGVALVIAFVEVFLLLQSKRQEDVSVARSQSDRFKQSVDAFRKIVQVPHLCTCNLRGLKTLSTNVSNLEIRVDSQNPQVRQRFGYYPLRTGTDGKTACASEDLSEHDLVFEIKDLANPSNLDSGTRPSFERMEIRNFNDEQQTYTDAVTGEVVKRFSARIFLYGRSSQTVARSTLADPAEIPVFVEAVISAQDFSIRGCYTGQLPATAPPSPSPSQCQELSMISACPETASYFILQCIKRGGYVEKELSIAESARGCGSRASSSSWNCRCPNMGSGAYSGEAGKMLELGKAISKCGFELPMTKDIVLPFPDPTYFVPSDPFCGPDPKTGFSNPRTQYWAESLCYEVQGIPQYTEDGVCNDKHSNKNWRFKCACPLK